VRTPSASAVLVALGLAVVTACSGVSSDPAVEPPPSRTYVAMGDSTASGMGIPPAAPGGGCGRSARAYPVLTAERWGLALDNRTCAGARIEDLRADGQDPDDTPGGSGTTAPSDAEPQVAAVDQQTDLVTVTVGGNDLGYLQLFGSGCADTAESAAPCRDAAEASGVDIDTLLRSITRDLRALLAEVQDRAPDALVLVVGYGSPAGKVGPCAALPLTPRDFTFARRMIERLNVALRTAVERAGATYVDTYEISRGHGVCDTDPWVNGPQTDGDGAPGHARSGYHAAVADRLDEVLSDAGWTP
jgi:lysophospholipase L1-like esterase